MYICLHVCVFLAGFHDQAVFKCTKYYITCVFRIMKMLILKPVPQTKPVSVMFSRCYTKVLFDSQNPPLYLSIY